MAGGLMSFFNLGGNNTNPNPAPSVNNANMGGQPSVQQNNEPGNRPVNGATVPGQTNGNQGPGNDPNASQQQKSNPLDVYSKMFDTKNPGDAPPTFSIDPKQMDGIVQGLDFTKGIDPAVIQKAQQGDAQALMEMIHHVGRNSYRAALEHGGVLTDKFVGARESYASKGFPQKVREELVTNQLASNTPNFQHPVVRQQLTDIAKRFQAQHPDATAKEIGDMSIKYLQDLTDAIRSPEEKTQQANPAKPEERGEAFWDSYFSETGQTT